ncbi:MAG: S41 family peptidase [Trebonia sp.]
MLPELLRERHFGIATGLVGEATAAEAARLIQAARERVVSTRPRSWGGALGDLNDQLRICLRDRHLSLRGSRQSRIRSGEPVAAMDQNAPAVEVEDQHGVLSVTLRRFAGGAEDDRRLWEWARGGLGDFGYERIVVDLRGNSGGNDALMLEWILPAADAGARIPGTSAGWFVGEAPLGLWNPAAVIEARDGLDAVPGWHRAHRHVPAPGDVLQVREEPDIGPLQAGVSPWNGKMLVLVDGQTKSSGESAAWMLQHALGGLLIGGRTAGMIEYGNITPYLLPASGLHIGLTTKHNDFGMPVELIGLPVHAKLDPVTPLNLVTRSFDRIYGNALPV